jgi:uncharacterized HAD superfamily protein
MIYVIDIDGTLCKEEHRFWEYEKAEPYKEAINKVNALFGRGNHIIIHTSRFKDDIEVTRDWLNKYKVRYHHLIMDKPRADVYVDNAAKRMDEI